MVVVSYSLVFSVVLVSCSNYMNSDHAWCPQLSQYSDYALLNLTIHTKTTGCRVLVYVF